MTRTKQAPAPISVAALIFATLPSTRMTHFAAQVTEHDNKLLHNHKFTVLNVDVVSMAAFVSGLPLLAATRYAGGEVILNVSYNEDDKKTLTVQVIIVQTVVKAD